MGIHPPIRQFDHGPQWVGKPILVYIRDEQTIRSFLKARIVEYSEEDSSYQIMYPSPQPHPTCGSNRGLAQAWRV
eukprot:162021-Rhodomonas_salina.1